MAAQTMQNVAASLCKHFHLDPKKIKDDVSDCDISSLYSRISKSEGNAIPIKNNDEVMKWISFAESCPDSEALKKLNEELATKSVLLGDGLRPSEADVIIFSVLHSLVTGLSESDRENLPHLMRWMDYIQNIEELADLFEGISLKKEEFEPPVPKSVTKVETDSHGKKPAQSGKDAEKPGDQNLKHADVKKAGETKDATQGKKKTKEVVQEKKKSPNTEAAEKDKEVSVSLLNIQVGLIRKAWKHPSADSLLCEEIDVGDAKLRQVVSGLAKYYSPEELTNRQVVLITNVKPGKLRDVVSEGLVLCASNEDHTVVEPLLPPEGAKIGERVSFAGIDGKPEDVLNPKKKQLEKITPHLFTDEKGVATYKGIPFMTSGGPCTASIGKASIK